MTADVRPPTERILPECSEDVRESLRRRQFDVLGQLLTGSAPAGFDPRGCLLTGRILAQKRVSAAVAVAPELLLLADWRPRLTAFAMTVPPQSCAHSDVAAFVRSVPIEEPWHRVHLVYTGRRRVAVLSVDRRRRLYVGAGSRVWCFGRVPRIGRTS